MKFSKTTQADLNALPLTLKGKFALGRVVKTTQMGASEHTLPVGTIVVIAGSLSDSYLVACTLDVVKGFAGWEKWGSFANVDKVDIEIFSRIDIELYK